MKCKKLLILLLSAVLIAGPGGFAAAQERKKARENKQSCKAFPKGAVAAMPHLYNPQSRQAVTAPLAKGAFRFLLPT